MSAETINWLNTRTLIGFTEKRGTAWHYRKEDQGDEPNHYPLAIPVDDVLRRLFAWHAVERPIYVEASDEGLVLVDDRKAIVADDNDQVLGIFSSGYTPHQYDEWLIGQVANLLDDDLGIGSAGLLKNRGQAWVSVEVPENITTPEGVVFRPNLVACTSFDGSLATTYKRVVTNIVCDNTLAAGLSERGQQVRIKHSRHSTLRLSDARDALAIVHTIGAQFAAGVERLCNWDVNAQQFSRHLDLMVPVPKDLGRGHTMAVSKRERIEALYGQDDRVSPWAGTAFGVLQAHNTFAQHYATVRGAEAHNGVGRGLRNMENAISGKVEAMDSEVIRKLRLVTA